MRERKLQDMHHLYSVSCRSSGLQSQGYSVLYAPSHAVTDSAQHKKLLKVCVNFPSFLCFTTGKCLTALVGIFPPLTLQQCQPCVFKSTILPVKFQPGM